MSKSFVELNGGKIDIQDLQFILNDKNWSIELIENKYLLSAKLFDSINGDYEILLRAQQFLDILNGLASAIYPNHIYVTANSVYQMDKNNKLKGIGFLTGKTRGRSRLRGTLTENSTNGVESSENKYQKWIEKSKSNSNVREILHYFNNQNWWNLYKIYEIIRKDSRESGMKNLVTKKELNRFTRTANDNKIIGENARHATFDNESVKNPMYIKTARQFIFDLFEKWIESEK